MLARLVGNLLLAMLAGFGLQPVLERGISTRPKPLWLGMVLAGATLLALAATVVFRRNYQPKIDTNSARPVK